MRMRKVEEPENQRAMQRDDVQPVVDLSEIAPSKLNEHDVSHESEPDVHPEDHLALPSCQSKWLFRVSWLSVCTFVLAMYMHLWDLALVPAGVLVTSLNYWRWPDYSW